MAPEHPLFRTHSGRVSYEQHPVLTPTHSHKGGDSSFRQKLLPKPDGEKVPERPVSLCNGSQGLMVKSKGSK